MSDMFIQQQINDLQTARDEMGVRMTNVESKIDSVESLLKDMITIQRDKKEQNDRIEKSLLSMREAMPTEQSIDAILSRGLALRAAKLLIAGVGIVFTGYVAYVFGLFKGPHS